MPRTTRYSSHMIDNNQSQEDSSAHEESRPRSFFQPSQAQLISNMFMPHIEGPRMDWTVNDGLYHRFMKWHLKCENILECELVMLSERRKCKKVIAWSGDFGMDQYVFWSLSTEELMLDTIWEKFEEFCKPQSNELWARFDLLTNF